MCYRWYDPATAQRLASYSVERYRCEYTGAYGSPELDRTGVPIERIRLSDDGRSVDLTTVPLKRDWVYAVGAGGVSSKEGETLVHSNGVYTLDEIPEQ